MITAELFKRAWPYLLGVALVIGALLGAYHHGVSVTDTAWQSKWDKQAAQLADANAKLTELARTEEQRRQHAIDEVRDHAQQQIAAAQADAIAADAAADSLRDTASKLADRASTCTSDTQATKRGKTGREPGVVLADVLRRADQRAGQLAAAYDRARAAGLACELAYDALSKGDER